MGGASGAKSGDRVLGLPHRACLTCPACAHGEYDACTSPRLAGVNADGYFGERFTSTERNLLSVPTVVSTRATLFAVDAAPIVRAFSQIDLEACTSVLIFGAGVPGILAALLTKRAGVTPILVDPIQPRLELARQLEVATVINPFAGHLGDDVLYATNGRLADAVIDTAGAATALAPLADAVATGATVVVTAAEAESHIPTRAVLQKELKVLGALPTRNDLRKALDAVEPLQSKLDDLVSTTVELSVVPETLAMAAASPESYLKLFVRPDA
jgi:hypothetical protein